MVTGLSIYYQRDWSNTIPQDWKNAGAHIARVASPLIGLYYPDAGHIISNASSALTFLSSGTRMSKGFGTLSDAWGIFKTLAEFLGNATEVKTGLLVHTGMSLAENFYNLRNFKTLSWSEVGEKMIPVVSNGLYLATFYNFSKKTSYAVIGASLLFQASLNAYKAQQAGRAIKSGWDIKIFDTAAHAVLSVLFFLKARSCYQEFRKIEQVVARFRHPSLVKVDPIAVLPQPNVETSTAEKKEKAADSKHEEPLTLPLNSGAALNSKDPVKHFRVKREEPISEDSADLAKRWEVLDRKLEIAN
jgi:hypothetical protein